MYERICRSYKVKRSVYKNRGKTGNKDWDELYVIYIKEVWTPHSDRMIKSFMEFIIKYPGSDLIPEAKLRIGSDKMLIDGKELKDTQGLSGHMRLEHAEVKDVAPTTKEIISVKPQPIENLIKNLNLPEVANGTREVFDAGVEYGMKSILIGVRIAFLVDVAGSSAAVTRYCTPLSLMPEYSRTTSIT